MNLDGVAIYQDGVDMDSDAQEKIKQLIGTVKIFTPNADISLRFLKNGQTYEGLLWGWAGGPVGLFNRGPSLGAVLEGLRKKIKKECLKLQAHCQLPVAEGA